TKNMESTSGNLKALYFSPHFWWTNIERGVYLADAFGKEIIPDFEFRKWLRDEKVEHDSTIIHQEGDHTYFINPEYGEAIKNDYFFEVFATSKYGHKVTARSVEDLYSKHQVDEKAKMSYSFKVDDLTHFISMYFQNWLLFDTYYDWVKWQLYYDFLLSKLDNPLKELYQYMWTIVLNQVELQHNLFKDVAQYKKFRDKLDSITKESNFIENKITEIRQKKAEQI
ncbi:MAG TPA: hypothetical protein VK484_13160, partial [Ferruginibacter sp.]|nr:hypothetical protein [Ferruginibacter sp.]